MLKLTKVALLPFFLSFFCFLLVVVHQADPLVSSPISIMHHTPFFKSFSATVKRIALKVAYNQLYKKYNRLYATNLNKFT